MVEGRTIVWILRQELCFEAYGNAGRTVSESWGYSPTHEPDHLREFGTLGNALRAAGPHGSIVAAAAASRDLFLEMVARAYGLHLRVLVPGGVASQIAADRGTEPSQIPPIQLDERGLSFPFIELDNALAVETSSRQPGVYRATYLFDELELSRPELLVAW
jgi:hypothetical protein